MALHSFLVTNLHGVVPHDLSQKKIYSDGQVRGCFAFQTVIYSDGSLNIYIFLFERFISLLEIKPCGFESRIQDVLSDLGGRWDVFFT